MSHFLVMNVLGFSLFVCRSWADEACIWGGGGGGGGGGGSKYPISLEVNGQVSLLNW